MGLVLLLVTGQVVGGSVRECVATAESHPAGFSPQLKRCLSTLPSDALEAGLAFEHSRPAVTEIVRDAVRRQLATGLANEQIDAARAAVMLGRVVAREWEPYRDVIYRALDRSQAGRRAIEAQVTEGTGDAASLAACEIMNRFPEAPTAEARALVFKQYLERAHPCACSLVSGRPYRYRTELRAQLEADRQAGRVRELVFREYAYAGGWSDLLLWSRDVNHDFAEAAARSLENALSNSVAWGDADAWRAFLIHRIELHPDDGSQRYRALEKYAVGASRSDVGVLLHDARRGGENPALGVLAVLGDAYPEARSRVVRSLQSDALGEASAAIDAMVYADAKWVELSLARWLAGLDPDRFLTRRWMTLVLKAGFRLERSYGRDFGFHVDDGLVTCGLADFDSDALRRSLDLDAFGLADPSRRRATPQPVATPPSPFALEVRRYRQVQRLRVAVERVVEYTGVAPIIGRRW